MLSEIGNFLLTNLAVIISLVSMAVSGFTLWFSEVRGPDIVFLKHFKQIALDDEGYRNAQNKDMIPRWFSLEPIEFLFANHGGKTGTILKGEFQFNPDNEFDPYFKDFSSYDPIFPITISGGNNCSVSTNFRIDACDWKRVALVKVLKNNELQNIKQIVTLALTDSKYDYQEFCEYMEKQGKIGTLTLKVIMTKGRFITNLNEKTLFKEIPINKRTDVWAYGLRKSLERWEMRRPNKAQLINEICGPVKGILNELKRNQITLQNSISASSILIEPNSYKTEINSWNQLCTERQSPEMEIKWHLINKQEGLKDKLKKIYIKFEKYNNQIDEVVTIGDIGRPRQFEEINSMREVLNCELESIIDEMSRQYSKIFSQ